MVSLAALLLASPASPSNEGKGGDDDAEEEDDVPDPDPEEDMEEPDDETEEDQREEEDSCEGQSGFSVSCYYLYYYLLVWGFFLTIF